MSDKPGKRLIEAAKEMRATLRADFNDCNSERARWKDRAQAAEAERDRLREALKGLIGLVQLVRARDDCPIAIKQALTDQYRLDDAFEALAKEAGK